MFVLTAYLFARLLSDRPQQRLTHLEFSWGKHVVLCRLYAPEQNDAVRQHMQQMDAQIRQKVHQLQQHL